MLITHWTEIDVNNPVKNIFLTPVKITIEHKFNFLLDLKVKRIGQKKKTIKLYCLILNFDIWN